MGVPTQITLDGREEPILAPLARESRVVHHAAPGLFDPAPFAQQAGQLSADLEPAPADVAPCEWCGSAAAAGTCPRSIPCPVCGSGPGAPCYRPSGHRAPRLHEPRIAAAEGRTS